MSRTSPARKGKPKKTAKRKAAAKRKRKAAAKREAVPQLRTSERTTFKRCRWQWGMTYGKRQRNRVEKPALRFGSLIHAALELRYPPGIKRGPKPAETFERLYEEELKTAESEWGFRDSDGEWSKAAEVGVDMLEMYVELYGRDEEWEVIASEMTFQVPVYPPEWMYDESPVFTAMAVPRDKPLFYYVGTMDGVWRNRMDGGVRINDYKTTSGNPVEEGRKKHSLDEQATAYWTWGVDYLINEKVLKPRQIRELDGMLYTFLRKAKRDPRPQNSEGHYLNKDGSVSKVQPQPYFHREIVYRSEAAREAARKRVVEEFTEMQKVRSGELAIYKSPGLGFPDQQCVACPVRDMCELHEEDADWKGIERATMVDWDPYSDHEVKQSEQS